MLIAIPIAYLVSAVFWFGFFLVSPAHPFFFALWKGAVGLLAATFTLAALVLTMITVAYTICQMEEELTRKK